MSITNNHSHQLDRRHHHHQPALEFEDDNIVPKLENRRQVGSLRKLVPYFQHNKGTEGMNVATATRAKIIDFSSNDYLGLAQCRSQHLLVEQQFQDLCSTGAHLLGSTGSRLLTGDSNYATQLETKLATLHNRPAALLCNSGYDANLSVLSSLTTNCFALIDELCHNSIQMGLRLSKDSAVERFEHNNLKDLRQKLATFRRLQKRTAQKILIVVESVYSMDGDQAPLTDMMDIALRYNASIIVDEAHGLGVFGHQGMGLLQHLNLENHPALLCSIHTFGKAAGCHGAVIACSQNIKEYLINYGRPIIYSTSLPLHSLVTINCSYESMSTCKGQELRNLVNRNIQRFRSNMINILNAINNNAVLLVESKSPIQALIVPGNTTCVQFCELVYEKSNCQIRLYPIRSPTVPKGQERIRIILHSHNTFEEVDYLVDDLLKSTLVEFYGDGGSKTDPSSSLPKRIQSRL